MAFLDKYYGISVTLSDTTAHPLLALLCAVDNSLSQWISSGRACTLLQIQADDSNGANTVYIGDSNVATSRCGYRLLIHESNPYRKEMTNVPLDKIWVLASAATCILNVEIFL